MLVRKFLNMSKIQAYTLRKIPCLHSVMCSFSAQSRVFDVGNAKYGKCQCPLRPHAVLARVSTGPFRPPSIAISANLNSSGVHALTTCKQIVRPSGGRGRVSLRQARHLLELQDAGPAFFRKPRLPSGGLASLCWTAQFWNAQQPRRLFQSYRRRKPNLSIHRNRE